MRFKATLLTASALLVVGGCATIVKGSTQTISVSSNVDGASVFLDGEKIGVTPFVGLVPKNKNALMVQKEGYQTSNVVLSKTLEPIFWGNIITGGTIGSLTDFASGAAYAYAPATYQVDLRASSQTPKEFEQELVLRKFAMVYLDKIAGDISRGGGEYSDAMLALLNRERTEPLPVARLRDALAASRGDAVTFGREILSLR